MDNLFQLHVPNPGKIITCMWLQSDSATDAMSADSLIGYMECSMNQTSMKCGTMNITYEIAHLKRNCQL